MNEILRISDQLSRSYDGDPWYGRPLAEILQDIFWKDALKKMTPSGHNIWEITLHISSWIDTVMQRLKTNDIKMPADGDWPVIYEQTEEGWQRTLRILDTRHRSLLEYLKEMHDEDLEMIIGGNRDKSLGSGLSAYVVLHGLIQHNTYHSGQISLLKKLNEQI